MGHERLPTALRAGPPAVRSMLLLVGAQDSRMYMHTLEAHDGEPAGDAGSAPASQHHDEHHEQSQSLRGFESELGGDQLSQNMSQRHNGPAFVY